MGNTRKPGAPVSARKSAWEAKEQKAIERFAAWERYEDGEDHEDVSAALDALTVAHAAATFEWASGPLKW